MLRDDRLLQAIEDDFESAAVEPREREMLRYVSKLTRNPQSMTRDDVSSLRSSGFSDRDVLQICEVAAYYAYVNRIADGLGVTVEPGFDD